MTATESLSFDVARAALSDLVSKVAAWSGLLGPQHLFAAGAGVAVLVVLLTLRALARKALGGTPAETDYSARAIASRAVARLRLYFFAGLALLLAMLVAGVEGQALTIVHGLFVAGASVQAAELLQSVAMSLLRRLAMREERGRGPLASAIGVLGWFVNFAIWSIALVVILDNAGVDVTAMIAGLGVGGIAVGLAAQGIFRDMFAALSILFERPFRTGDFISNEEILGTVEKIGLRATRLRALSGELLVVSNNRLLDRTIQNFGQMYERRVVTRLGVTYQTSADALERSVALLKEAVTSCEGARFDRAHFAAYGASSLDLELVYYVSSPDYNRYMDINQDVLLKILRTFGDAGVEFAFPTRTLFIAGQEATRPEVAARAAPTLAPASV